MKYLTLSLVISINSVYANENQQNCRAGAELNPNNRFSQHVVSTDVGDYKVINDAATGLQWSYCFVGQGLQLAGDQTECTGQPVVPYDIESQDFSDFRQAIMDTVQQESQRLDGRDQSWRLPNIKELLSIYNKSCNPAIYPIFNYAVNASDKEIEGFANAPRIELGNDMLSGHTQAATITKGLAYQNYTVVSDTPLMHRTHKPYYSVNFNGWGGTIIPRPGHYSSGMLRLVREIPQP